MSTVELTDEERTILRDKLTRCEAEIQEIAKRLATLDEESAELRARQHNLDADKKALLRILETNKCPNVDKPIKLWE